MANATQYSFVLHPNHELEDYATTGIVSVRNETLGVDELEEATWLNARPTAASDDDAVPEVRAVVIERGIARSSRTLQHIYSPTADVVNYLKASSVALLREDAAVLQYALVVGGGSGKAAGGNAAGRARDDRAVALTAENKALRAALGLPFDGSVAPSQIASAVTHLRSQAITTVDSIRRSMSMTGGSLQPNSSRPATVPANASSSSSLGPGRTASAHSLGTAAPRTKSPMRRPRSSSPGVLNDDDDGRPAPHSPLQWDTETEAAVNARSKYRAYGREHEPAPRLDAITQLHLVTRLHDKSVDQKQRTLARIEEQVTRSLGLQERRVLSPDEEHELGARLHDQQREKSKRVSEELKQKYLPALDRRALTPDVQKASAKRMHDETMERAKKNLDGLVDKYVTSRMPPSKKLDKESQEAMASRLCAPKA